MYLTSLITYTVKSNIEEEILEVVVIKYYTTIPVMVKTYENKNI